MERTKALIGRKVICNYLNVGKKLFYDFIAQGAPIAKRGKIWIAHREQLDDWFITDGVTRWLSGGEQPVLRKKVVSLPEGDHPPPEIRSRV